jgi:hypothetical protein
MLKHYGNLATQLPDFNNGQAASYKFIDDQPQQGNNYYRIKCLSDNSSSRYSKVVKVERKSVTGLIASYPNPVTGSTVTLKFTDLLPGAYPVSLSDASGKMVLKTALNYSKEDVQLKLPASLSPGTYNLLVGSSAITLVIAR